MSGNRRKNTPKNSVEAVEQTPATRVVAIPKEQLPQAANAPTNATRSKSDRIGDILRQARLDRGDDLYQIAEYLCIKPAFLIALENSRYDEFPADAYVIGFLRTYANFLGVDGKEAVDKYRYDMAGRRKKPILSMPTPVSEGRAPTGIIMVGATVALLLIYALWYGISSANRTEVNVPPLLPVVSPAVSAAAVTETSNAVAGLTAPVTASSVSASGVPSAAPGIVVSGPIPPATETLTTSKDAGTKDEPDQSSLNTKDVGKDASKKIYGDATAGASRLTVRATQSSWVMITDEYGKAVFDNVLKPGESYKVPNRTGLSLTTGNGSGIVLSLDGNDLPKVANGAPHVVRNINLDPDHLMPKASPSDR